MIEEKKVKMFEAKKKYCYSNIQKVCPTKTVTVCGSTTERKDYKFSELNAKFMEK